MEKTGFLQKNKFLTKSMLDFSVTKIDKIDTYTWTLQFMFI